MSNGATGMLGALGLAALAGGLAYGAHMIIPASEPDVTPSVSPSVIVAKDDPVCAVVEEMAAFSAGLDASAMDGVLRGDEAVWSDPANLDAIHAEAQLAVDGMTGLSAYAREAGALVSDADVKAAFEVMARATDFVGLSLAGAALNSSTYDQYMGALLIAFADPDIAGIMDTVDAASALAEQYVLGVCGIGFGGAAANPEADLKSDVSTLGKEIATYYVDWAPGDPEPVITVSGGSYFLLDTNIGASIEGAEVTDQYARGPTDWCVEVTSPSLPDTPWTYSAQSGLAQGTCS